MTAGGSQTLCKYRIARRDGSTVMTACVLSGMPLEEARMWEAEDAKNPPPPEAYELLNPAPAEPAQPQENDMGRPREADTGHVNGEVPKPDFDLALKLYREDIKPAQAKVGEYAQEQSTAYKDIKKKAHVEPNAARAAFRLDQMEEAKRDDWLRSFNGLLKTLRIFMPRDMVDNAEDKPVENVVPMGDRSKPKLATIPMSDGKDNDLAGDDLPDLAEEGHNPDAETPDEEGHDHQQAAE